MTIHHTIAKPAALLGVTLEETDGAVIARHGDHWATATVGDGTINDAAKSAVVAVLELVANADKRAGSVVPMRYKARYTSAGHPTHCGDWLAETLNRYCRVIEDGKEVTDLDALEAIAAANDVAPTRYGKLGVATNGWQGRYRMTIRNMLVPRIAARGVLYVPQDGSHHGAPEAWRTLHGHPRAEAA